MSYIILPIQQELVKIFHAKIDQNIPKFIGNTIYYKLNLNLHTNLIKIKIRNLLYYFLLLGL